MSAAADRRRAARQRQYRQRLARSQAIYPVTVDGAVLDMLVRLGHLADGEATDRAAVSKAISDLLADAARH